MRLLCLTKYDATGPSSRYRYYNYAACFKDHGIEMTLEPLFDKRYFTAASKLKKVMVVLWAYLVRIVALKKLLLLKNYDLLLIEYELLPFFPAWFEWLLQKRGITYIVDYDDAIFHKYDLSHNPLIKAFLKNKIAHVMKRAHTVIVCNAYLESYAKKHNPNTFKIPTVVLIDNYIAAMKAHEAQKTKDTFVIGWIGSRTTSVYIIEILEAIEKFAASYEDVRFDLVGFDQTLLTGEQINACKIRIVPWREAEEIDNILALDVGIMPLHDDPWSRGKCGFKLIQYMSCKKPVIASPVGVNTEIVTENINGFLVKSVAEWYEAFEKMYQNPTLRAQMAEKNYEKILEAFHHQKLCIAYAKLIKNIIGAS